MSNAQSGASYEAILVDRITQPAQQIVQVLAQLDAAFQAVTLSSQPFAQNMQLIGAAMQAATRQPVRHAEGLGQAFNRVSETASQLGSAAGRAIEGLGNIMKRAGQAAMGFAAGMAFAIYDVTKAAGDATETLNAFSIVMETNTRLGKQSEEWAENFADQLNRSSIATKRAMTTYQSFWKGLGATNKEATKLTKTIVQLQTDFGSFFNTTDDEGLRRFIAALSGSSEVLDQFGVNIRENMLEQKGMELGFGGNVRKMTEYQKAMIRAAILTEVLSERVGALGDAARTQFQWQNLTRSAEGQLLELRVALGNLIIPELRPYLQAVTTAMKDLAKRTKEINSKQVKDFLASIVSIAGVGAALTAAGVAFTVLGSAVSVAAMAFAGFATAVGAVAAGGPIAAAVVGVTALVAALGTLMAIDFATEFPFIQVLQSMKQHMDSAVASVKVGMETIRRAVATGDYSKAWDAFKLTAEVVFNEMALSFVEIMGQAVMTMGDVLAKPWQSKNWVEAWQGMFDGEKEKNYVDKIRDSIEEAKQKLKDLRDSVKEPMGPPKPDWLKNEAAAEFNISGLIDVVKSEQFKNNMMQAGEAIKKGFEAARDHANDIRKSANDWADSMASPQEKFIRELQKIQLMEKINPGGRVTPEMVKRAQMKAAEAYLNELPKVKFQASSVGTFSRAVAANVGDFAPAFDPMLDEQKKTNDKLEAIKKATEAMARNQATF